MAIVIGIVSQVDRKHIIQAGYTLADHPAVLRLLRDMQLYGAAEEEAVAVWADCDVTDLLVLDETSTSLGADLPGLALRELGHPVAGRRGRLRDSELLHLPDGTLCPARQCHVQAPPRLLRTQGRPDTH